MILKSLRTGHLLFLSCFLSLLCGCGGGGGGGTSTSHAPQISNLSYSPTSARLYDGGGQITVTGTFSFTDSGGDLATLHLATYDSQGVMTNSTSAPVPGTSGVTSGIIQGRVIIATTPPDNYTFKIYLTDAQGTRSNELQGSFPVYPGPVVHLPGYLPAHEGGTLLVHDVAALTVGQQIDLYDWTTAHAGRSQVIGITGVALAPLVERGQFLQALFRRLNVLQARATV